MHLLLDLDGTLTFIGAHDEAGTRQESEECGAEYIVETWDELLEYL